MKLIATVFFASLALFSGHSYAFLGSLFGGSVASSIVYDPTNFVKNALIAATAVQQELNQLKQIEAATKSNSAGFDSNGVLSPGEQAARVRTLISSAQRLSNQINSSQKNYSELQSLFGAGNYKSTEEFGDAITRRRLAGDATAKNLFESAAAADSQLQASMVSHQKLNDALGGVAGVTEATQATTSAVGVLIQQNQAILGLMSSQSKATALQVAKDTAKATSGDESIKQFNDSKAAELAKMKKFYGAK